jgi:hypothetical protein
MTFMPVMLQSIPWLVTSAVLLGIALAGWRRTRATGALLISIAAGLQILDSIFGMLTLYWTYERSMSYTAIATVSAFVRTGGHLVSSIILIVGLVLLLQRLPTAQPRK